MNRLLVLCTILLLCLPGASRAADPFAEGVRPTDPLPPEEQAKTFKLPPGFEIQLVAAEPDIQKPMNMAWDHKGRLWISMSREYPFPAPLDKPARDSIRVLEDFDENGRARKITTFVDGLNIPIGLYPWKDGVIAWSIPNIWFFRDTDGDGKADKREVLYGPFGWERDTHGNQASFTRGFDGWLYATHGFNNISEVTARDGSTVKMHSGHTYRMRLDGETIQHHTYGQVNPFGLCFDPAGNIYTADCHSAPIYELLRGAYYPSFGKPHDGLGFGPTLLEHSHGSTAICGIIHYSDDKWPDEFQDNILIGNVMTSRINRDTLIANGSTKRAREEADFLTTTDPWFRPVDLQLGPDGALYIADFYNRIIGHYEVPLTHPGRDRERARIWRVVYTGKSLDPLTDFTKVSIPELANEFKSANITRRMLALQEIVERGVESAPLLERTLTQSASSGSEIINALWALHRLAALSEGGLANAARHQDPTVRVHAMRILAEIPEWPNRYQQIVRAGLADEDALVQRAAADALGLHPAPAHVRWLLDLRHQIPAEDPQLLHTVRMALRDQFKAGHYPPREGNRAQNLSEQDASAIADVSLGVPSQAAGDYLAGYLQKHGARENKGRLSDYIRHAARYGSSVDGLVDFIRNRFANEVQEQLAFFNAIQEGSKQRGVQLTPKTMEWGRGLADSLLAAHASGDPSWINHPVPNRPASPNPWFLQQRASADGQQGMFVCSLPPGGEHLTGLLRSREFKVPARLEFHLAGHDGQPGRPPQGNNLVRLVSAETGKIFAQASAPRNDTAQRIVWDLAAAAGQGGFLEIIDADTGNSYAWIAAGRFQPPVVPLPERDPRAISQQLKDAAELVRTLQAKTLAPRLQLLLPRETLDLEARAAIASTLVSFESNPGSAALASLVPEPALSPVLREEICHAIARSDSSHSDELLAEAMRTSPSRIQTKLAQTLSGTPPGATLLVAMVRRGEASPQLLLDRDVKNKLAAVENATLQETVREIQEALPPLDEAVQKLIQQKVATFNPARAKAAEGRQLFEKNCAVCHQIDGLGAVVGPQLDGIANRGLERIIEDTLDPNRNVDVNFRTEVIVLKDDDVITGLVRREEGDTLVLADSTGKETSIRTADIDRRRTSETSLMPSNFGDVLTAEEFESLMAFLLEKGAAK